MSLFKIKLQFDSDDAGCFNKTKVNFRFKTDSTDNFYQCFIVFFCLFITYSSFS